MFKKFLSRKLIIIIATAIVDVLIATGSAAPELKDLLLKLMTGLGSLYVVVEGIKDAINAIARPSD